MYEDLDTLAVNAYTNDAIVGLDSFKMYDPKKQFKIWRSNKRLAAEN